MVQPSQIVVRDYALDPSRNSTGVRVLDGVREFLVDHQLLIAVSLTAALLLSDSWRKR